MASRIIATLAPSPRSRAQRALGIAALSLVALTSLAALGHSKPFRPFLGRWLGQSGACPVSVKGLTPEQIDAHRVSASGVLSGEAPARSRAAGPFVIGTSTRRDVDRWAQAESVTCSVELSGTALRCADVPARALTTSVDAPAGTDTFFRFSPASVLVGLDVMRAPCGGPCNERLAREIVTRVQRDVGQATSQHGEIDAAYFEAPGLRAVNLEFHFIDYAVDVSVTRLAPSGPLTLREQYRAVSRTASPLHR